MDTLKALESPTESAEALVVALPKYLYHYTSYDAIRQILSEGRISAKQPFSGNTEGIYFTSLPPESTTAELMFNNYNYQNISRQYELLRQKLAVAIEFQSSDLVEKSISVMKLPTRTINGVITKNDKDTWIFQGDHISLKDTPYLIKVRQDVEHTGWIPAMTYKVPPVVLVLDETAVEE